MTLYSQAVQEQYINNADDRARGEGNNPFGSFRDTSPAAKQTGSGPFAGDEAEFSFKVYGGSDLTRRIGSAVLVCRYNFDRNAFCEVAYKLAGGTLFASGAFNLDATIFTLAVSGGTGAYSRMTGEVDGSPNANHGQRLAFLIQRA